MPFVKTRVEIEGHVNETLVEIPDNEVNAWGKDQKLKIVGQRIAPIDGIQRVTGRATYVADVQLPGQVWCKILRSPYAHAEITAIDTSEAEKIPGVLAIIHSKNTQPLAFEGDNFIFNPTVRYVGCEVAAVAAVNEHVARDAIDSIKVTYKPLPFVVDPLEAMAPGAPQLRPTGNLLGGKPRVANRGDIKAGEAAAEVVVEETFRMPAVHHSSMEPHGSVAVWENADHLTIYDSTQSVLNIQTGMAAILGLPKSNVRARRDFMGGGFGSKTGVEKYHVIAALLAKAVRLPVKVTLERWEELTTTGHRPQTIHKLRIGARKDGTLTFIDLKAYVSAGAYSGRFAQSSGTPAREMYLCPNVHTEEYAVYTNHMTNSAMRGPGNVEGMAPLEVTMDKLAAALGMDPVELRRKNNTPWGDQVAKTPYTSKGLLKAYDLGAEGIGWASKRQKAPGAGNGPLKRGVGVGSLIWSGGGGPPSSANVIVNTDGSVVVQSAFNDIGGGQTTIMAMVCAEEMGVPLHQVGVQSGDTALGATDAGTFGSRLTPSFTPAVRNAAAEARKLVLEAAAQILDLQAKDLFVQDGVIKSQTDPKVNQPLPALAAKFTHPMVGRGFRGPNPSNYRVNVFGAQFAEVEVDVRTGAYKVLKVVAAHDCGRAINPMLVEGQIYGGIGFGLGYGMTEERVLDPNTGVALSANYVDYKLPAAIDSPEQVPIVVGDVDEFSNNTGTKGMAEPPSIPTAGAIANAIYNATGAQVTEFPITPQRVMAALKKAGKA